MSGGHFGIDLRRNTKYTPEIKSVGPSKYSSRQNYIGTTTNARSRPSTAISTSRRGRDTHASFYPSYSNDMVLSVVNIDKTFDEMMANTRTHSIQDAFARPLRDFFAADDVTVWIYHQKKNILVASSKGLVIEPTESLVGLAFRNKSIENIKYPLMHECYCEKVDAEKKPSLYFTLATPEGNAVAVVQMVRSRDWGTGDIMSVESLVKKFSNYVHFLFGKTESKALRKQAFWGKIPVREILVKAKESFGCRVVELWKLDEDAYSIYDAGESEFLAINDGPGLVQSMFEKMIIINLPDCRRNSHYQVEIDGVKAECVLCVPFADGGCKYGLVFRGKIQKEQFTHGDEVLAKGLIPLIKDCLNKDAPEGSSVLEGRLQVLLDVAEKLSGVLDIDSLIPTIMERACSLLNTERCSLFLVDNAHQELVTTFHGGLDNAIRLPLDQGIVGHTATTGEILNIPDAYSDERFNSSVDKQTGFKTQTILTVPIFNNRGEIAGVTEMINKKDGRYFDESDIKMMMAFNVFCGISLDNARLYQISLDLTRQLRGFVEMSSAMSISAEISDMMTQVAEKARGVIAASRCTIFLANPDSAALTVLVSLGDALVYGTTFADIVARDRQSRIFSQEEILQITEKDVVLEIPSSPRSPTVSKIPSLYLREPVPAGDSVSICCFPLLTTDRRVLGVMEMCCKVRIMTEDMKLLDCFAVFASFSLEKVELKQLADFGQTELRLQQLMTEEERQSTELVPAQLALPADQLETLFTIGFDAPAWDGIGHFRVIWAIFNTFGLFQAFHITNEKFYRFLSEISSTYNKVPYHNWRHAVDVSQFITYEIKTSNMDETLTKFELFALSVAAVCHDANHDGFTNAFNVKAETPLGILFKNQSVLETHHCTVAISVISKEECNVFESLSATEAKEMWNLVIQLILSTDMAKHHEILKNANDKLDAGPLNLEDQNDRFVLMQLLLKCADISNVSRPFELADKWCDVLCEEFFRQGDLEKTSGMEYTSPLNDRAHLDKPKSQIGFYTFVCLPLYQTTARAIPALQVNVDQVEKNLSIWKAANERKDNNAC